MAHTAPKPHGQRSKGGLEGKRFLHIHGLNRVAPQPKYFAFESQSRLASSSDTSETQRRGGGEMASESADELVAALRRIPGGVASVSIKPT